MWFKKKSQISGYNQNTAYDGTYWRTNEKLDSWSASQTLPSVADAGNYFYLPALGYYGAGQLTSVGSYGWCWSSSATPWRSDYAYSLDFLSGRVRVHYSSRAFGFWVEAFQ